MGKVSSVYPLITYGRSLGALYKTGKILHRSNTDIKQIILIFNYRVPPEQRF